jgi:Kef-type K+ transport system membrane component KefB
MLAHFAKKLKVPKVTAYILVGIILGPTAFNFITVDIAHGCDYFMMG